MGPQESTGMPGRAEDGAKGHGPASELPRVGQSNKGPPAETATSTPPARPPSYAGVATVKPSAIPPQVRYSNGTAPGSTPPGRQTDDDEVAHLRRALEAARKESEQRFAALQDAEQRHAHHIRHVESESRAQNKRLLGIMATERERAARAEVDHKNTCKLLEARTAELASAQAFLGPTDELSERDVASRMETLNEEIFQLSALLADSVEFGPADNSTASALEVVRNTLGEYICSKLTGGEDEERLGMLQIALQATATHWSQTHIRKWTFNSRLNSHMKDLYKAVRGSLDNDVAKRWKIITQKGLYSYDDKNSGDGTLLASLHGSLNSVMHAASCVAKDVGSAVDLHQALEGSCQAVVRLTLQLRTDMNVGVNSTELDTVLPRPDKQYRSETMDAESTCQRGERELVGCGISLGLVRGGGGRSKGHTLIRPKVIVYPSPECTVEMVSR